MTFSKSAIAIAAAFALACGYSLAMAQSAVTPSASAPSASADDATVDAGGPVLSQKSKTGVGISAGNAAGGLFSGGLTTSTKVTGLVILTAVGVAVAAAGSDDDSTTTTTTTTTTTN